MNELQLWGIFFAVAVGTFALRLSFLEIHGRWRIPRLLKRALPYVPASVLAALVFPAVLRVDGQGGDIAFGNPQLPAALVAAWIAWYSRSTILTLITGMATLWFLKFVLA